MRARLDRLEALSLHEILRPDSGLRMPDKRTRRQYMELHDKLVGENLPDLLAALLGEDEEEDDGG